MRLFETIREIKALNKKRKKAKAEIGREEKTDAEKCADALRSILDASVEQDINHAAQVWYQKMKLNQQNDKP